MAALLILISIPQVMASAQLTELFQSFETALISMEDNQSYQTLKKQALVVERNQDLALKQSQAAQLAKDVEIYLQNAPELALTNSEERNRHRELFAQVLKRLQQSIALGEALTPPVSMATSKSVLEEQQGWPAYQGFALTSILAFAVFLLRRRWPQLKWKNSQRKLENYLAYPAPAIAFKNGRVVQWNQLAQDVFSQYCKLAGTNSRAKFYKWLDQQIIWAKHENQYFLKVEDTYFRKKTINPEKGIKICYYSQLPSNPVLKYFDSLLDDQDSVAAQKESRQIGKDIPQTTTWEEAFELEEIFSTVLLESFPAIGPSGLSLNKSPALKVIDDKKFIQAYLSSFLQILHQGIDPEVQVFQTTAGYQAQGSIISFQIEIGYKLSSIDQELFKEDVYQQLIQMSSGLKRKAVPSFDTRYLERSNFALTTVTLELSLRNVLLLGKEQDLV